MKAIFLIALSTSIFAARAYSQQTSIDPNIITVGTQSPDAASLGKFGNIPVNYNTGATSISIPVYEINVGKIKLPISLDYHTGGIRVDETSSSVGIGWALNGIGVISRNVVGLPDEQPGGYIYSPSFDSLYTDWASDGAAYGSGINTQYAQYLFTCREGISETDPDIFSYSINGQSGKFIYRKDGTLMQIPHTNNSISQVGAGFKIIDENGIAYIFDQVEHVEQPTPSTTEFYVGTWRLSKMIDPNTTDTIFFTYESACNVNIEHYISYTYSFGTGPDCAQGNLSPTAIDYTGEKSSMSTITHLDEMFPTAISWRGGQITLGNACDRSDKASEKRLNTVDIYATGKGRLRKVKSVKLYQSYFYNSSVGYSSSDERNYRLRLDSVAFLPVATNDQPELYRITYNAIPIASRESVAQDQWGFNNGQFNNTTSMPRQNVVFESVTHTIGEANRDPDSSYMQACMINSIQYPTGGKSVFEFEAHHYPTNISYTQPEDFPLYANGGFQSTQQATFTPDPTGSAFTISYNFTSFNYSDVTGRPNITITDQVTGTQTFLSSNINPSLSLSAGPTAWSPVMGHTYLIVINIYTTTDLNVKASIDIAWVKSFTNVPETLIAGGLRVKSVTNYDINGAFINKDVYKYGYNEDGLGQLLTPETYLLVNYANVSYKCGASDGGGGCAYAQAGGGLTYYANCVYPASQFSGSPVLYGFVTKYQFDSTGTHTNGKSSYSYRIFDDQSAYASTDYGKVGVLLITNEWKNGFLGDQYDYKYNPLTSGYDLIHQKVNNYQPARQETLPGLKVKNMFNWNTSECYTTSMAAAGTDYLLIQIPINSGAMLLQSSSDTTFDQAGNKIGATVTYSYNDTTHLFPTSKQLINSKGSTETDNYKYPHDLAVAGNAYYNMVAKNIISPLVQDQKLYNGSQTMLQNVNYIDWNGNATLFEPGSIDAQTGAYPLETRIRFNRFDKYGNIIQQQKAADAYQSYIWDYQSIYPIAKCTNGDSASIAYTSFEAEGTGNWTLGTGSVDTTTSVTGHNSYVLNGAISKSGLNSSLTYIVSYWTENNSSFNISGTIAGYPVKGKTVSLNNQSWTLYVHKVIGQTTISLNGSGHIDELRLYPATAQMTTYTYTPLVGITSQCDVGNRVTYYEYDGLARLKRIRDQDYNILKTLEYQYQASGGCGSNCYVLGMQTQGGSNTLSYPVGAFDVHGKLVGNATGPSGYVSLWNGDTADARIGTLAPGSDSMHFTITLKAGQTVPAGVTGCRYYQFDLPWTNLDGIMLNTGTYVDFGDGSGVHIPRILSDTPTVWPAHTWIYQGYLEHSYPDSSLKTVTIYHNDSIETVGLDNGYNPATSLTKVQNYRGNFPQNPVFVKFSSIQHASALTMANITNWNSIRSITSFNLFAGDGSINPCEHVSYAQDFMKNNKGLQTVWTGGAQYYNAGVRDTTFKLTRLKADWNTYFTNLQAMAFSDEHWNREDLSALTHLQYLTIAATDVLHSNYGINNPLIPIPASVLDNILIQVAAGGGQFVNNGIIKLQTGGTTRTSASDAAVSQLQAKGWQIYIY
jgi:YD repeat-containing protein